MKSLAESLFDSDLVNDDITTLYDLFGGHIKKFQHTYGGGQGWTHFFNQTEVVKEWKKEGSPKLGGGFSKTTFPPDLQKFIAVILNNSIVTTEQLVKLPEDGNLDDKYLNNKLDNSLILKSEDGCRHMVRIQIGYIEGIPAGPDHGIRFRNVGTKRFKGLNTDKIEISIYCYDAKRVGFGCHIWTLLTDVTINELKKK